MPAICAVIVLYREDVLSSRTVKSLQQALMANPVLGAELVVLLYDNTPASRGLKAISQEVFPVETVVVQPGRNAGLPPAYNHGLRLANERGAEWLLLLDSDTVVSVEFLEAVIERSREPTTAGNVAAIVPHIVEGSAVHSPRYTRAGKRPIVPLDFDGIAKQEVTALNSGTLVRVSAVAELGGFTDEFWLDYLDYWLFRTLQRRGLQVYILREALEHSLSLEKPGEVMPLSRYQNMLHAEQYFTAKYGSALEGARLRLALLWRAIRLSRDPLTRPFALAAAKAVLGNSGAISPKPAEMD